MAIEIERILPMIGFRYYARGEYLASLYGRHGIFQIYVYLFMITIDMPWKHTPKYSSDFSTYYSFLNKKFTFRKWGVNP